MGREKKAKLFANGRGQAVRLPADFHFDGDEIFIRRDIETGDVILSRRPNTWDNLFKLLDEGPDPHGHDFLSDRQDTPAPERNFS